MGLLLNVYKNTEMRSDCTNNGVSANFSTLCVVNVEGPFEASEAWPAVYLQSGPNNSIHLIPMSLKDSGKWTMAGGNFAGTCDSRFSEAVEDICGYRHSMISIHDRVEN